VAHLSASMHVNTPSEPNPAPRRKLGCWAALLGTVIVVGILASLMFWKGFSALNHTLGSFFGFVKSLPSQFQTQNITRTFKESLVSVEGTNGDILEVATLEMNETISDADMKSIANIFYLGTTVSEIQVPVVYRYHIKLSDQWQLSVDGNVCTVLAPAIRPSQPPAIRTDQMQKKSDAGWLRFNAAKNLAELEKTITPTAERRAGLPRRLNQVREPSRKAVAEFVRTWLLKEQQWGPQGIRAIVVRFPDEESTTMPTPVVELP
jgi:hypothetical protein